MKLNKCLRVGSRFDAETTLFPLRNDVVLFGFELFPQVECSVAQFRFVAIFAISKQQRHDGVDDNEFYRAFRKLLRPLLRGCSERVVVLPITARFKAKKLLNRGNVLAFEHRSQPNTNLPTERCADEGNFEVEDARISSAKPSCTREKTCAKDSYTLA